LIFRTKPPDRSYSVALLNPDGNATLLSIFNLSVWLEFVSLGTTPATSQAGLRPLHSVVTTALSRRKIAIIPYS